MQWTSQAFDVLLEKDIVNPLAPNLCLQLESAKKWNDEMERLTKK